VGAEARVIVEIPYTPRPIQNEIHEGRGRFSVLVCHRRFGKTVMCINELIKCALRHPGASGHPPRFAYVAPQYKQAKTAAWDYLLYYTEPIPGRVVNIAELRVDLPNGARVSLYGADNPDSLRGMYLDGVVLDEYAQMSPRVWGEVIRPLLSDRGGWAIFIGTPMGHNEFYERFRSAEALGWYVRTFKSSETGYLSEEELSQARREMSAEQYAQEFECSWQAPMLGAYYGRLIEEAENDGRVCSVPHDPGVTVETWWDLGIGDSTVLWFVQRVGREYHAIDYYESRGQPLSHYVSVLQARREERRYVYSDHVLPHDVEARELMAGKTRVEMLESLGISPVVIKRHSVDDGIEGVRRILPMTWFDEKRCERGIDALRQYRADWIDKRQTLNTAPLHDWASHAADAFRQGAMHSPQAAPKWEPIEYDNRGIV